MVVANHFCISGLAHFLSVIMSPAKAQLCGVVLVMIQCCLSGFNPTLAGLKDISIYGERPQMHSRSLSDDSLLHGASIILQMDDGGIVHRQHQDVLAGLAWHERRHVEDIGLQHGRHDDLHLHISWHGSLLAHGDPLCYLIRQP